jgi:hypothetical protein
MELSGDNAIYNKATTPIPAGGIVVGRKERA